MTVRGQKVLAHQHFCWKCYTKRGRRNKRGDRGWWRCIDRRCVRANECVCPEHEEPA